MTSPPVGSGSMLGSSDAEALALHVSQTAASGLCLAAGLEASAREVRSRRLSRGLMELASAIRGGQSLEAALAQVSSRVPATLAALLAAAEKSGHLGLVLEEWTSHRLAASRLRRRLSAALIYPALCLAIAVGLFLLLSAFVIPQFRVLFSELELALPIQTVTIFLLAEYAPIVLAAFAAAVLALLVLMRLIGGRSGWHWLLSQIPLAGKVWHWSSVAEGLRIAGLLIEHQAALPQALEVVGRGLPDEYVGQAFRSLAEHVAAGMPLWSGMLRSGRLPKSLVPLMRVGEQDGHLARSLKEGARMLEQRIAQRCDLIALLVPPILFLLLAVVIVATFTALFLPMVQLIQGLSY